MWAPYALIALGAAILLLASNAVVDAFDYRLTVDGDGQQVRFQFDSQTMAAPISQPLKAVRFTQLRPYDRQTEIDGSDSFANFTLDAGYFSKFATSPYYRFQALLRDPMGESEWRDLTIARPDTDDQVTLARPATAGLVDLPTQFHFTVHLHRMDVGQSVDLLYADSSDAGSHVLHFQANRHDRYQGIQELAANQPNKTLDVRYFPYEIGPQLATVAFIPLRAGAFALLGLLLLISFAAILPARMSYLDRPRPRTTIVIACLGMFTGSLFATFATNRVPHIFDANSYYFGAQNLAHFMLARSLPAVEPLRIPFLVQRGSEWFSLYPLGAPSVLAAGMLLRVPWLAEPALAVGMVPLMYGLARRRFGTTTALIAALLLAASPVLHLQAASFLSHVPAMFFGTCFLYGLVRYSERHQLRWVILGACALGLLLHTRELSTFLYGVPLLAYFAVESKMWRPARLKHVAVFGAICFLFAGLYLAFDWTVTGHPLLTPRWVYGPNDRLGFGKGIGPYHEHTPAAGLTNVDELLTSLGFYMLGWPYLVVFALTSLTFVFGRARSFDWALLSVCALFTIQQIPYAGSGIAFGPRYLLDCLPISVLLVARGFDSLKHIITTSLDKVGRNLPSSRSAAAAGLLGIALTFCNVLYFEPRMLAADTAAWPRLEDVSSGGLIAPQMPVHNAVVVMDRGLFDDGLGSLDCPRLDCDVVYSTRPAGPGRITLLKKFQGRAWYDLQRGSQGHLSLLPYDPTKPELRQPLFATAVPSFAISLRQSLTASDGTEPAIANQLSSDGNGTVLTEGSLLRYDGIPSNAGATTISLWFQTRWSGGDGKTHMILTGGSAERGWRLVKDSANNLRFLTSNGQRAMNIGISGTDIQPGDWHLVTALWDAPGKAAFIVDGEVLPGGPLITPDGMQDRLFVGTDENGRNACDCMLRDLLLVPRAPLEDGASTR